MPHISESNNKHYTADLLLLLVCVAWGVSFPLVKDAVALTPAANLLFIRFTITVLLLLPVAWFKRREFDPALIKPGVFCGLLLFLAFLCQATGLEYTSAGRAAFLTGINVVLVPLFCIVLFRTVPAPTALMGALLAFGGIYLLSMAGAEQGLPFNVGDVLNIGCAVFVALHILALSRYAPGSDSFWLAFIQFVVIAASSLAWSGTAGSLNLSLEPQVYWVSLYLAAACTVLAFWGQTWAQKIIPPTRAAVIFTTEPLFGALFAYIILDEHLGGMGWLGGGLIVAGLLMAEIKPRRVRAQQAGAGGR